MYEYLQDLFMAIATWTHDDFWGRVTLSAAITGSMGFLGGWLGSKASRAIKRARAKKAEAEMES